MTHLFDAATGQLIRTLVPDDRAAGDQFGYSISIEDGIVAVGAPSDVHGGVRSGSAYLFDLETGVQLVKLVADDRSAADNFGGAIDLEGGLVVVGAHGQFFSFGAAYVFETPTGDQVSKLVPTVGAAWDFFGRSVSIADGLVAVGAPERSQTGRHSGAAYLFDATSGVQLTQFFPSPTNWYANFGSSVSIEDGVVAVGSAHHNAPEFSSGAVFLFEALSGGQMEMLVANDLVALDELGISVALTDGVVATGAIGADDNGDHSGAAYLFDMSSGVELNKLLPSDGASEDHHGHSIALGGGVVAVGAPRADAEGLANVGAVYVYGADICSADLNGDGLLTTQDFLLFLNAWSGGDVVGDWNADGRFDTLDFLAYLNDWNGGC